jgi:hypothetical protein
MTPRSPNQQHQKSTTISRRLRQRAEQNLSVQPPEIPRLRNVRPRRATTLTEPHHEPLQSRHQYPQQHLVDWQKEELDVAFQISATAEVHQRITPRQSVEHLHAQSLDINSHTSPQPPSAAFVPTEQKIARDHQHAHHPAPTFPPSPLPSVTGSLDFEVPLSITDPSQSQNPFLDLQDMRSVTVARK